MNAAAWVGQDVANTGVEARLGEIEIEIRASLKRQWEDVLRVGELAAEAKCLMPHGRFTNWIKNDLGLSAQLIRGYMRAWERLGKRKIIFALPITAGLLLASPSVPEGAIAEMERRLEDGETFTVAGVEAVIDKYRGLEAVNVGSRVLLAEYGATPDGTPAKTINRSAVTSIATVTGEALERGVVTLHGEDRRIPDVPKLPTIVRVAAMDETRYRQSEHIDAHAAIWQTVVEFQKATVAAAVVNGFVTLKLGDVGLAQGDEVFVTIKRKVTHGRQE